MGLRVALAAGHHNSDGGNATEYAIVGPLTKAIATELRGRGADVRVITPNEGLGQWPGGLQDAARQVVRWAVSGWSADLFVELHTNAGGRGVFCVYPDWGLDVDLEVCDVLGPRLASTIARATGLPVWTSGVMSERSTAVGASGYRLGVFAATAPVAPTCTRLIIECGSHTSSEDLAIVQAAGFNERVAGAVVDALGKWSTKKAALNG